MFQPQFILVFAVDANTILSSDCALAISTFVSLKAQIFFSFSLALAKSKYTITAILRHNKSKNKAQNNVCKSKTH